MLCVYKRYSRMVKLNGVERYIVRKGGSRDSGGDTTSVGAVQMAGVVIVEVVAARRVGGVRRRRAIRKTV